MKPTPELINDWHEKARQMAIQADGYFDDVEHWRHFAELAAAWGAKQAQQTTDPLGFQIRRAIAAEDELRATKQTLEHAYAALQKVADKAQQTTEETDAEMALRSIASWLGVGGFNAPTVDAKVFERKIYEGVERAIKSHYVAAEEPELPEPVLIGMEPNESCLVYGFTAVQMHDHFAAWVLVGMGQSQDAKRLDWLNQTLFMSKWNGVIDSGSKVTWSIAPDYRHTTLKMAGNTLREAIDAAMQGGQQ